MCEPDVAAVVHAAAKKLSTVGAKVEDISVPMHRDGGCHNNYYMFYHKGEENSS